MRTCLVVDDFPEIRSCVSAILADAGFRVIEADDYLTARSCLEKGGIDVVLCDLALPADLTSNGEEDREMSVDVGTNAIAEFACDFPNIPVVAFSGVVSDEVLDTMIKFGAAAILSKPFTEKNLLEVMKKVFPEG